MNDKKQNINASAACVAGSTETIARCDKQTTYSKHTQKPNCSKLERGNEKQNKCKSKC